MVRNGYIIEESRTIQLQFSIESKMYPANSKWKKLHQSSKERLQSPLAVPDHFRRTSKGFCLTESENHANSIANLVSTSSSKFRVNQSPHALQDCQMKNQENEDKSAEYLRNSVVLKKELSKIREILPNDRKIIDSAINIINNYEQEIKSLKEQLSIKGKNYGLKNNLKDEILMNDQKNNSNSPAKDLSASTETIESLSSCRKPRKSKDILKCVPNYYFPGNYFK